jgi:hypothetical protein
MVVEMTTVTPPASARFGQKDATVALTDSSQTRDELLLRIATAALSRIGPP